MFVCSMVFHLNMLSHQYRVELCCLFIIACNVLLFVNTDMRHIRQQPVPCVVFHQHQDLIDHFNSQVKLEQPDMYLQASRFDIIVKMAYAYFYSKEKYVPAIITEAYMEHIRAIGVCDHCSNMDKLESGKADIDKRTLNDSISSFRNTINSMEKSGFDSSLTEILIDGTGFVVNGAHTLAAAVVLSKNVSFHHMNNTGLPFCWDYKLFLSKRLTLRQSDLVMLEWMKIQVKLVHLKMKVHIVALFSKDPVENKLARSIVSEQCSDGILYERNVNITMRGMRQLVTHMYGFWSWLEVKIEHMNAIFNKSSTYPVQFLFIYAKSIDVLNRCKNEIRELSNEFSHFKTPIHIADTPEESLILAEMILNNNSLQFINYARNPYECKRVATELAYRSSIRSIHGMRRLFVGRDDIMIDSGAVRSFYSFHNRSDIGVLFLHDVDRSILGSRNGMSVVDNASISNSFSRERSWDEGHFSENGVQNKWDLFIDPDNYGYCYGIKFVSLPELIQYK